MSYLSQYLNKRLFCQSQNFGKVIDFCLEEKDHGAVVSKYVIKRGGKKFVVSASNVIFSDGKFVLTLKDAAFEPFSEKEFCLVEDILDKQVIDITGRRLVRVNDILLKENGEIQIAGIDIGFSGVLRRLGSPFYFGFRNISIPWSLIEAFDYQTGDIKIKLTENKLNTFHPAEIADILEEVGTKERIGLVESLDAQKAAYALEEANTETQQSILEELPELELKNIINRMHVSEIVDVIHRMNPFTVKNIMKSLGAEKAQKVKKLSVFADNVAGGLMRDNFYQMDEKMKVGEAIKELSKVKSLPEIIIIVNSQNVLKGIISTKNLLNKPQNLLLKTIMKEPKFVKASTEFSEILRLFSEYNMRLLSVVDEEMKVIGAIPVDLIIAQIQEEEEENE